MVAPLTTYDDLQLDAPPAAQPSPAVPTDAGCTPGCAPGCASGGLAEREAEDLAVLLRALADPVRLRLYTRIAATDGQTCVCDLGNLGVSQPTVSHHLRKLREAGLIEGERRGNWVYYRALPGALVPVRQLLGEDAKGA